jgi:hypothetical protein
MACFNPNRRRVSLFTSSQPGLSASHPWGRWLFSVYPAQGNERSGDLTRRSRLTMGRLHFNQYRGLVGLEVGRHV